MFVFVVVVVCVMLSIMFFTLVERKLLALSQIRVGPYRVFQALQDGLKLFMKEMTVLSIYSQVIFILAPVVWFFLSQVVWLFLFNIYMVSLLFLVVYVIQSFMFYAPLMSGVSSNSKYSNLACLRMLAQMISYEINISVFIFSFSLPLASMSWDTFMSYFLMFWVMLVVWAVLALVEMNRAPFDMMEAESELVSGVNVEYSGLCFAMLFLSEYGLILFMSFYSSLFFNETLFLLFLFIFTYSRCVLPRFRYDFVMGICWQVVFPFMCLYACLVLFMVV